MKHISIRTWFRTGAALACLAIASDLAACAAADHKARSAGSGANVVSAPKPLAAEHCARLGKAKVDGGVVESVDRFPAGSTITGGETAGVKASTDFCRVRLKLSPAPGSNIKVEVWLPNGWNNKLFALGGAGFDGGLNPGGGALLDKALTQGYAAIATDVGHTPQPNSVAWAHQRQAVVDFGHRGNHVAAVAAKQIIRAYYGAGPKHAYFLGCSNGGRDAIMEASRYPEDYDGVIAGAPARRYLEIVTQLVTYSQVSAATPTLASKLSLVHDAVVRKCDQLDGVKDGILENPLLCRFDPSELECKGTDAKACLTPAEAGAFRKIYGGVKLGDGRAVISGPVPSSEGVPGNWTSWVASPVGALAGQEIYRWMAFDDPDWKIETFDLDRDYPAAREKIGAIINAEDADLRAFAKRGGKLIMYQGWADPVITPRETIDYHEAIARISPAAASNARLFMVPGMMHCAGGPGANVFDMQPALEAWVEKGQAPERIVAVEAGPSPTTSHPLCAWPKTARYNGSGSTKDARNFSCKAPT